MCMPFTFSNLEIPDVIAVEPKVFNDNRGVLMEAYDSDQFSEAGIHVDFQLDIISRSKTDVIRGLHFQYPPYQQAKLVHCSEGKILDVAVDVRRGSTTFGDYVSLILTGDSYRMLFIPSGFAHGFAVIDGPAMVHYKSSSPYAPNYEAGVRWDDPIIDIDWPIRTPELSERDASLPSLQNVESL